MKPEAYPEVTTGVEMVQTHVSWIFLTDTHAYKIKKPVDFGFLNFSTIDRRRFYCNEEVRLNRRLCPDMYEAVVELRESEAGFSFLGDGAIVDYAVRMKRLPAERMLNRLVDSGEVSPDDMRAVARIIAEFHRTAPTSPTIADNGRIERIMFNWQENFEQSAKFSEAELGDQATLPDRDREMIRAWVFSFAARHGEFFQRRVDDGFIRECDGDIHLENICFEPDAINIFDCIEFNERFRYCDTAADIAFLLMDLDFHCRTDLAAALLDEYLTRTGDQGSAALLDFYKLYRAFVRGKVESLLSADSGAPQETRETARHKAICYFRLARGYVERHRLPTALYLTCGLIGCGKSSLADHLGFELGIPVFSSDILRKRMAGLPETEPVPEPFARGLYAPDVTAQVYTALLHAADKELADGRSIVVDASFSLKEQRNAFIRCARSHGVPCIVLHVQCPEQEQRRRVNERQKRGSSPSDGRCEIIEQHALRFEAPSPDETVVIQVDTTAPAHLLTNQVYAALSP